jgi:hypothetical protein
MPFLPTRQVLGRFICLPHTPTKVQPGLGRVLREADISLVWFVAVAFNFHVADVLSFTLNSRQLAGCILFLKRFSHLLPPSL